MSKHTPGPWTFVQGGSGNWPTWNVRIGTRGVITLPSTASMEVMDADARLIAAAPDLLSALQTMLNWGNLNAYERVDAMNGARAAIAKAGGGNG